MTLIMYERIGFQQRRPSPFSWRIRYAIAHKGIETDYRPVRFADVETIRRISGQDKVPVVIDGDQIIHDSWNIAAHLETHYPDHPSLFGGETARGVARHLNHWADLTLGTAIRRMIAADFIRVLAPEDQPYFRRSREAAFGCTLEEYCADRPRWSAELKAAIAPLELTLAEQPFVSGADPGYADYAIFSVFQYARLGCPHELVTDQVAIRRWRDLLVAKFDALGDRFPGYPR